jgi:hypothetical protein
MSPVQVVTGNGASDNNKQFSPVTDDSVRNFNFDG